MVPYSPQSTWAHSPAAKSSLRKASRVARPDPVHVVLDDGDAAVIARLAQSLEDLLGAVRMGIEPAHDLALERIELAGARPPVRGRNCSTSAHLATVRGSSPSAARGLRHGELLATEVVADLADRSHSRARRRSHLFEQLRQAHRAGIGVAHRCRRAGAARLRVPGSASTW